MFHALLELAMQTREPLIHSLHARANCIRHFLAGAALKVAQLQQLPRVRRHAIQTLTQRLHARPFGLCVLRLPLMIQQIEHMKTSIADEFAERDRDLVRLMEGAA